MAASLAAVACWEVTRPVRWANLVPGLWLLLAPWLFGYGVVAAFNSCAVGVPLAIFAAVRGRVRQRFGGGWSALWGPGGREPSVRGT